MGSDSQAVVACRWAAGGPRRAPGVQRYLRDAIILTSTLSHYSAVSFYSPSTSTGISIPFPHLTLHAISRAPLNASSVSGAADGGPCIYCQIDESEALEDSDEMEGETREVIIIPSNPESRE